MRLELTFYGNVPSKKNRYRAIVRKTGEHKGKAALVKDRKLTGKLGYLVEQIPRDFWDIGILHPSATRRGLANGYSV